MTEFEWDPEKDRVNIAKHGVAFDDARRIFDGRVLSWIDGRSDYGEVREISIGSLDGVAIPYRSRRPDPHHFGAASLAEGEGSL